MGSICGVCEWSLVLLFDRVVGECLAVGVLAIPDGLRGAIGKADHVMLPISSAGVRGVIALSLDLPIANVIPKLQAEDNRTLVVPERR